MNKVLKFYFRITYKTMRVIFSLFSRRLNIQYMKFKMIEIPLLNPKTTFCIYNFIFNPSTTIEINLKKVAMGEYDLDFKGIYGLNDLVILKV